MAKKPKSRRINPRSKLSRFRRKKPFHFYLLLIIIFSTGFIGVAAYLRLFSLAPPQQTTNPTGFAVFQLVDAETGDDIRGQVILTRYDDSDEKYQNDKYDNPISTNEPIYISEPVYASVYKVTLEHVATRKHLPVTISPMCSDDPNNPKTNTIRVQFYANPKEITAKIFRKDGFEDVFDERDFRAGETCDIELSIDRDAPKNLEYPLYGHSCFVPDYLLPDTNEYYELSGYGLYLVVKGTKVDVTDENGEELTHKYIPGIGGTIILLNPVSGEQGRQKMTITFKDAPTDFEVFQGFIEDYKTTRVALESEA